MEGEPEAYKDETLRSIGISPRERLERIEDMLSKMDVKLDTKLDALDKRVWTLEVNVAPAAKELQDSLKKHDLILQSVGDDIEAIRSWMWRGIGGVTALIFAVEFGLAHHWF